MAKSPGETAPALWLVGFSETPHLFDDRVFNCNPAVEVTFPRHGVFISIKGRAKRLGFSTRAQSGQALYHLRVDSRTGPRNDAAGRQNVLRSRTGADWHRAIVFQGCGSLCHRTQFVIVKINVE